MLEDTTQSLALPNDCKSPNPVMAFNVGVEVDDEELLADEIFTSADRRDQ
jgi:hypothetical protein